MIKGRLIESPFVLGGFMAVSEKDVKILALQRDLRKVYNLDHRKELLESIVQQLDALKMFGAGCRVRAVIGLQAAQSNAVYMKVLIGEILNETEKQLNQGASCRRLRGNPSASKRYATDE